MKFFLETKNSSRNKNQVQETNYQKKDKMEN